jgi:hypothetical protein
MYQSMYMVLTNFQVSRADFNIKCEKAGRHIHIRVMLR